VNRYEELKTIINLELFEALSRRFSGVQVCFSVNPRRGTALIAKEILGAEVNYLVAKYFYNQKSNQTVFFPKHQAETRGKRHSAILADYDSGLSINEITVKHQISKRWAEEIINTARRARGENFNDQNRKVPRSVIATKEKYEAMRTAARAGASFAFLAGRYGVSKTRVIVICRGIPDSGAFKKMAEERVKQEVIEAYRTGKNPGQLAYLFNMPVISIKKILETMNHNGKQDQKATA
jgi:hypothetical protein